MGICIAYQGKLRDRGSIPELVRDLRTKAESAGWPCKTMAELVAEDKVDCSGLEGVTLYPHRDCEPLHFHFDRDGVFVNHTYYSLVHDPEKAAMFRQAIAESSALAQQLTSKAEPKAGRKRAGKPAAGVQVRIATPEPPDESEDPGTFFAKGVRYNWTKTQFAGPKVHVAVCAVLRHVKQRYAPDLEIKDDSGYFAHGDYEKLEAQLAEVDYFVSITRQAAKAAAASGASTLDAFIDRLNAELADAPNKLH